MAQTPLNMYANFTGSADAAATLDIPEDGTIKGIYITGSALLDASNEAATFEVSFIATNQIVSNDSRATLAILRLRSGLLTSGAVLGASAAHIPMDVEVAGGERMYVHAVLAGTANADCNAIIFLETRRPITRRSRRRR